MEQTQREAAQQQLGKRSKLDVAGDAIVHRQMARIADDEMKDVRALKNKYRKDPVNYDDGDSVGDMIICDDFHVHKPEERNRLPQVPDWPPPVAPKGLSSFAKVAIGTVAGAVLGTGLVGTGVAIPLALDYLRSKPAAPVVVPEKDPQTEVRITATEGKR